MTDPELLDFLDRYTTLHYTVQVDYYVDSWEAKLLYDESIVFRGSSKDGYRGALQALAKGLVGTRFERP